ncbi:MAG: IPExxxVDY family protein [Chitinophagales bacterium]
MVKKKLDMNAIHENFFADTAMLGIATALPAYHLCWVLNRHFDINFIRDPDQDISMQKKDDQYYFPIYKYDLPNSSHRYLLYKLKNGTESLLPETRQLDYLWLIETANPEDDVNRIAREIRNIPDIQLAQVLVPEQLKSVDNLLM